MPSYELTADLYATQQGIDKDLFRKQIQTESKFDPRAYNAKSGASGIAQIIPRWHPGVNVWDPVASLSYAAKWMKELLTKYKGDYQKALAAYNWGPGSVDEAVGKYGGNWLQHAPAETKNYLATIMGGDTTSPPILPGLTGGENPSDLAQAISEALSPSSITKKVGEAFLSMFGSASVGLRDAAIDKHAGTLFFVVGILALVFGLILTATRSSAGQTVLSTAQFAPDKRVSAVASIARRA